MAIEIKDVAQYEWMWTHDGLPPGASRNEKIKISDALMTTDAPVFLPKVISNIVKEAAEPLLVGTSLLQRINYTYGQQITFGAVGALTAADIAEGTEYPERTLSTSGGTVVASIGKSGIAVKISEEMIKYSQYDVIGMHLRACGKALARHKEQKIFNMIRKMGTTVFDNVNPAKSVKGTLTGRDGSGNGNGSCTMDDVFDTYATVVTNGFVPNTLLMHPLSWIMWVKDPTLRAFALVSGGGTYFAGWTGSNAAGNPWGLQQGGLGPGMGWAIQPGNQAGVTPSPLSAYPQTLNVSPNLPSYMNIPFRIIVSPLVFFDPAKMLTDIYMFDSAELGALIVDEDITTDEFNDPRVDIRKIKMKERYAVAILNEGQAIATMRNVHVVPNRVVEPAISVIASSASLADLDPLGSVL
jgi:hypothetical protein